MSSTKKISNEIVLGATILKNTFVSRKFKTIEELSRTVMKAAQDQSVLWFGDEDAKYRCSLGAIRILAKGEDKLRVDHEIKMIRWLSDALAGTQKGAPNDFDRYEPIGFQRIWDGLKEERKKGME